MMEIIYEFVKNIFTRKQYIIMIYNSLSISLKIKI